MNLPAVLARRGAAARQRQSTGLSYLYAIHCHYSTPAGRTGARLTKVKRDQGTGEMRHESTFFHLAFFGQRTLAGNQPRAAIVGEVLEAPLDEDQNAVLEFDDVHQVNE